MGSFFTPGARRGLRHLYVSTEVERRGDTTAHPGGFMLEKVQGGADIKEGILWEALLSGHELKTRPSQEEQYQQIATYQFLPGGRGK